MKMTPLGWSLFILILVVGLFFRHLLPLYVVWLLVPLTVWLLIILLRNKSGPIATADETTDAMLMNVPPGKARIYVMRKEFASGQQGMNITLNGQIESQIRTKFFLMADVEPGVHQVKAKMSSGSESAARVHRVKVKAGEAILLDINLIFGVIQGTPEFTEIRDSSQAVQMLQNCRLVHWK